MFEAASPREIPRCIAKLEPDAAFGWLSSLRLVVVKDDQTISLSADDLKRLFTFFEANHIKEQV